MQLCLYKWLCMIYFFDYLCQFSRDNTFTDICLLATLLENHLTNFVGIFRISHQCYKEQLTKLWTVLDYFHQKQYRMVAIYIGQDIRPDRMECDTDYAFALTHIKRGLIL